jgi:uncharacterized protein (TIGR02996 family)
MTDHAAFLRAILAAPADDTPLLVYADWLDDRGDPDSAAMSEFLRLTAGPPSPDAARRLHELAAGLDPDWLAVVSRLPVENCRGKRDDARARRPMPFRFDFLCDRRWEGLRSTDDPAVRHCDGCGEDVYYCDSITVARGHARQGHCVAIDLGVIRRDNDLAPPVVVAGMPSPESVLRREELRKPDRVSAERDRRRAERPGG